MPTIISYPSQGSTVSGELYNATPGGLIVIAYGSDGLTNHLTGPWETMIRGYAEALAEKGFAVLIPDYFGSTGTVPGPAVFELIAVHRDRWQKAISDAIDYAKTLPGIDASRIGLLGFSLGGHLCLRLRGKAKVVVEFFAPMLNGIGSAGPFEHAQIHHGEADNVPFTGFENAPAIKAVLEAEGTETELFPYPGASHGFIGGDADNTAARDQSKEHTLACFANHL